MRYIGTLTLVALIASEALVLAWLWLAVTGSGLGLIGLGAALLAVLALNGSAIGWLTGRRRRRRRGFSLSPVWMIGSLGALATGPMLAGVFLLVGGLLWAADALDHAGANLALVGGGGAAVALGFGSMLWGHFVGLRRVQVDRIDLPVRDLPAGLAGVRIAHITDLHIGPQLRAPLLREFVDRVNELEADLIVITGDIFDFDPAFIEEGCGELGKLSARHGVYGILGNHDHYTGAEAVAAGNARDTSIRLLRNEWVEIEIEGATLCLMGIDDPGRGWSDRDSESPEIERLAREAPQVPARVLLVHRPSFFRQAARLGLPISLAGHTHGGQISLPRIQHQNVARLIAHWTRGLFEDGESLLYVNRGLGIAGPPIRLNCPREIALLRLVERRG